jgi:hypothetical protein
MFISVQSLTVELTVKAEVQMNKPGWMQFIAAHHAAIRL